MYLIDTNVWLHRLLDHDHSQEVADFLSVVDVSELLLTDFTLHSLGVILCRLDHQETFIDFVQDVLIDGGVEVASIEAERMERLVTCMADERLDFDDAYQYVAAEKHSAVLVSYDKDFDETLRGRKTPETLITEIRSEAEEPPEEEAENLQPEAEVAEESTEEAPELKLDPTADPEA